jgi:hypothetical protein
MALRPADLALLLPKLEEVQLASRQVLYQPGDDVSHVYFPCGSTLLSFVVALESGKDVEAALIGREGAVEGSSAMEVSPPTPERSSSSRAQHFVCRALSLRSRRRNRRRLGNCSPATLIA